LSDSMWVSLMGSEVRFREAGGARTRTFEDGAGDPVVLLHGVTGHAEAWCRNVVPLARDNRVIAVDMLGHGMTDKPRIGYSIDVLAQHVLGLLDALSITRAHLVGQSLGGWVAGWIAAHHPERVLSFTSVTGAGLKVTDDAETVSATVTSNVATATHRALANPTREEVRTRLEWLMCNPATVTDELVETRYRLYSDPDFQAVAPGLLDAVTTGADADEFLTPTVLAAITCPTLIVWTRQNPTMPWQVGQQAAALISNARFVLIEDAGHWPQFEKPDEFNATLGAFLSEVSAQQGAE